MIDILTNATDGPVLFWPINWQARHSPVSYWEKAYYPSQFICFEVGSDLVFWAIVSPDSHPKAGIPA